MIRYFKISKKNLKAYKITNNKRTIFLIERFPYTFGM